MLMVINDMMSEPQNAEMIKQLGMSEQVNESLHMLQTMRPIDFALNILTINIISGIMLGIPIAAITQRTIAKSDSLNSQR